jgi:hypothetical protein
MKWRRVVSGVCVAAVFGLLAGCGGSSVAAGGSQTSGNGGSQSGSGGSTPTIQGIETPSSVSVVTATNSN